MNKYISFLFLLFLTACSGSGGTQLSAPSLTSVSGVVFAGAPFSSGVVNIYNYTTGSKGALLAHGNVDSSGTYKISLPNIPSAILIEASAGCYSEKVIPWATATSATPSNGFPNISFATYSAVCPPNTLSAAVAVSTGTTPLVVAVTPYTHAAVGLAQYKIRTGSTVTAALNSANSQLSQWVGVDIIKTLPAEITATSTYDNTTFYGALLGGIPSWIYNIALSGSGMAFGTGLMNTMAFADAMQSDFVQDGLLNGTGRNGSGNPVVLQIGNTNLSATIYRHQLALYANIRVRAETKLATFLPALVVYNDSVNSLLDVTPVIALDAGQPVVTITWPLPGMTLTANEGPNGIVNDDVGLPPSNTKLFINGSYYADFIDTYMPSSFINTTVFLNGAYTITIQATNALGHTSSASANVTFSNSCGINSPTHNGIPVC